MTQGYTETSKLKLLLNLVKYVDGLQAASSARDDWWTKGRLLSEFSVNYADNVSVGENTASGFIDVAPPTDPVDIFVPTHFAGHIHGDATDPFSILTVDESYPDDAESGAFERSSNQHIKQAHTWISTDWTAWSIAKKKQLSGDKIYSELFRIMRNLKEEGGAEDKEVVICAGLLSGTSLTEDVAGPLLVQPCELVLDEDGTISITPAAASLETTLRKAQGLRKADANVSLRNAIDWFADNENNINDDFIENGVAEIEGIVRQIASKVSPPAYTYDSFSDDSGPTQCKNLKSWEAKLRGSTQTNVPLEKEIAIDTSWRIVVRKRPIDRVRVDLTEWDAKIKSLIEASVDGEGTLALPEFLEALVSKNFVFGNRAEQTKEPNKTYPLFPLPYNEDQGRIITLLGSGPGAIVQGPPGTGKSHTIANIISHYLATGKRVLVSSHSAGALDVIRDKIPETIRPLTAALLSSDAKSIKEFDKSVSDIEYTLSRLDGAKAKKKIDSLEQEIILDLQRLDSIIEKTRAFCKQFGTLHQILDETFTIDDMVRDVGLSMEKGYPGTRHDLPADVSQETKDLVDDIVGVARRIGQPIFDRSYDRPINIIPPTQSEIDAATNAAKKKCAVENKYTEPTVQKMIGGQSALSHWEPLHTLMTEAEARLREANETLSGDIGDTAIKGGDVNGDASAMRSIQKAIKKITVQVHQSGVLSRVSNLPAISEVARHSKTKRAIDRLGNSGGLVTPILFAALDSKSKAVLKKIKLGGEQIKNGSEWSEVNEALRQREQIHSIVHKWRRMEARLLLPKINIPRASKYEDVLQILDDACQWVTVWTSYQEKYAARLLELIEPVKNDDALFLDGCDVYDTGSLSRTLRSIEQLFEDADIYKTALNDIDRVNSLAAKAQGVCENIADKIPPYTLDTIEDRATHLDFWDAASKKVGHAKDVKAARARIFKLCEKIQEGSVREWLNEQFFLDGDEEGKSQLLMDKGWRTLYANTIKKATLAKIPNSEHLNELFAVHGKIARRIGAAKEKLVAEKAWLSLSETLTNDSGYALRRYAAYIKKQGAGRGKRATRYRRQAREAMRDAFGAINCWIMPHDRVCESMPAEFGLFDLVIIDEASQSNIKALPTILRGKQLLVVGDDKQVSPMAVGKQEAKIQANKTSVIKDQPNRHDITEDFSLYHLYNILFRNYSIMLREHFRCAGEIISYSNETYYNNNIIPLRIPQAEERMTPPVVDILLKSSYYNNKKNDGEAKWIAAKILDLVFDDSFSGRTIGVVTLPSSVKQSLVIRNELDAILPYEKFIEHDIFVGTPPDFQGKEKDVIFVSTVWDGRDPRKGPANATFMEQRFNVAMSRAKNRVYLVRSNYDAPFKPESLIDILINHIKETNTRNEVALGENTGQLADDSSLVTKTYNRLRGQGYNVIVTPPIWHDYIDLYIEDSDGNRVGVQCHESSPRYSDMQTKLNNVSTIERVGWQIIHALSSDFYKSEDDFMGALEASIAQAGVSKELPGDESARDHYIGMEQFIYDMEDIVSPFDGNAEGPHSENFNPPVSEWVTLGGTHKYECDSAFEKDVLNELVACGYAVLPQYKVGPYRIDLMVGDNDGHKLAIECDGDSFHGVDAYEHDNKRQRWIEDTEKIAFWRCFYSEWTGERGRMILEIKRELERHQVSPVATKQSSDG